MRLNFMSVFAKSQIQVDKHMFLQASHLSHSLRENNDFRERLKEFRDQVFKELSEWTKSV